MKTQKRYVGLSDSNAERLLKGELISLRVSETLEKEIVDVLKVTLVDTNVTLFEITLKPIKHQRVQKTLVTIPPQEKK